MSNGTLAPRYEALPTDLFVACRHCDARWYEKELGAFRICPGCQAGFPLTTAERLAQLTDEFTPVDPDVLPPQSDFPNYQSKLAQVTAKTGLTEAVTTGRARIGSQGCWLGIMDTRFIMGSLGQATGERLTRLIERAIEAHEPVVIFTASGGARMQEGIQSLMQMAKVSAALTQLKAAGLFYLVVLTDPTMGGVTASFAMDGNMILAEPRARIGFAGRRVIEQTLHEILPADFQTAEAVLAAGFVDAIVARSDLKATIEHLLALHGGSADDTI